MSRIVVLGETLIDVGPEGHGPRIGGACANVAVTLARLGCDVALVGAVGDDEEGAWLVGEIAKTGVDVSCIARVKGKKTGRVHLTRDGNSWRFRPEREDGAEWGWSASQLSCIDAGTVWIHVGSSSLAREPAASATREAIARRRSTKAIATLSSDLNARIVGFSDERALIEACAYLASIADVLKVSASDLKRLGKAADRDGARTLHDQRRAIAADAMTIATFGQDGALAMWGDVQHATPPVDVVEIEPSGAGDAFMAGMIQHCVQDIWYGEPRAHVLAFAARIAAILGAHATTAIGATTALTEIESTLERVYGVG